MAVANYHAAHGCYPPAYVADEHGKPMHSWRVLLLPYIEQQSLYERYDFAQPWNSEDNLRLADEMPSTYAFHGEYSSGTVMTNYLAVVGEHTAWPGTSGRQLDEIIDSHATTILLVENADGKIHWMEPRDLHVDSMSFSINVPNGISSKYLSPAVVMVDGTLRRFEDQLARGVLEAMLTVDGGEQVESTGDGWEVLLDGRLRERERLSGD